MKKRSQIPIVFFFVLSCLLLASCRKNEDISGKSKSPVWIFNTGGDPYQSKPCIKGDSVVFYAGNENVDEGVFLFCINRNTGALIWEVLDSLAYGSLSPVIYGNLIISGGLNPHARILRNGSPDWKYIDPDYLPMDHSIYNNPLIVGDAVYFAGMVGGVSKHSAASGGRVWKTENGELWTNLRASRLVYSNGKLYFGNGGPYTITSFIESNGAVEWSETFEKPFANFPAVTDDAIYIGIQDSDINNETLRCLNLSDRSVKWAVKLGAIFSDVVVVDDKVYAIGMSTIHCRSAIDGSAIWHYDMSAGAVSEPLVTGNKVYVGYGKGLLCLNASTGELLWEYKTAEGGTEYGFTSPALDGDKFYVSCSDGNVYCFNVD